MKDLNEAILRARILTLFSCSLQILSSGSTDIDVLSTPFFDIYISFKSRILSDFAALPFILIKSS